MAAAVTLNKESMIMPRYVVERRFPEGLVIPIDAQGKEQCERVVAKNAEHEVTWVHSYVSADRKHSYCVYDARTPEAIRHVATRNGLPVERITEVRVLDPYFYA
jgi:Nickel responsive protein SCO4226-like